MMGGLDRAPQEAWARAGAAVAVLVIAAVKDYGA